jgi:hypothetical protein
MGTYVKNQALLEAAQERRASQGVHRTALKSHYGRLSQHTHKRLAEASFMPSCAGLNPQFSSMNELRILGCQVFAANLTSCLLAEMHVTIIMM